MPDRLQITLTELETEALHFSAYAANMDDSIPLNQLAGWKPAYRDAHYRIHQKINAARREQLGHTKAVEVFVSEVWNGRASVEAYTAALATAWEEKNVSVHIHTLGHDRAESLRLLEQRVKAGLGTGVHYVIQSAYQLDALLAEIRSRIKYFAIEEGGRPPAGVKASINVLGFDPVVFTKEEEELIYGWGLNFIRTVNGVTCLWGQRFIRRDGVIDDIIPLVRDNPSNINSDFIAQIKGESL